MTEAVVAKPVGPTFSVVMAAYNASGSIRTAIESVRAQTRDDWELIVTDDGSNDDTSAVVETFVAADPRISLIRRENAGCAAARNLAARAAVGAWLCPLDTDDAYEPTFLDSQASFISEHPGFDIYSCNVWAVYPDGDREVFRESARTSKVTSFSLSEMLVENRFCVITVFRRALFERLGGFREHVYNEDWDFWLRAMSAGARHIHNPDILAAYSQRRGSMTDNRTANLESHRDILAQLLSSGAVPAPESEIARGSLRHYEVAVLRAQLEARMLSGDVRRARREYLRVRVGYRSLGKYLVALVIVMVSPRIFAAILRSRNKRRGS